MGNPLHGSVERPEICSLCGAGWCIDENGRYGRNIGAGVWLLLGAELQQPAIVRVFGHASRRVLAIDRDSVFLELIVPVVAIGHAEFAVSMPFESYACAGGEM